MEHKFLEEGRLVQFEKLPKWVKDHIRQLERRITTLEAKHEPHSESKVIWGYGELDLGMRTGHIPDDVPVRWMINEELFHYFDVRYNREDGRLRVSGNPMIIVEPQASNTINVRLRKEY